MTEEPDTTIITDPGQLTLARLDHVLARGGALTAGGLAAFASEPFGGDNSRVVRLALRYRPESTGERPPSLLLKMVGGDGAFGSSEVDYYARDYVGLADAPIPRCYDARYAAERGAYHLLLADLSETHRNNWEAPPTAAYGRAAADALAALHAHRWGPARLAAVGAALSGLAQIDRYLGHIRPGLEPMLDAARGEIEPGWGDVLRRVVERHPAAMRERTRDPEGFTLVHGDVNPGNVLSPVAGPAAGPTYLIDRQPFDWSLTVWLGVADVAYLMVHWWPTDLRRRLEMGVLQRYHDGLLRRGVAAYPWDRLVSDYRLCAVQSIYVAVEWCVLEEDRTTMRWVWLPQLKRSLAAFTDLGCGEVFA